MNSWFTCLLPMTFISFRLYLGFHISCAENQLLLRHDKALWPVPTVARAVTFLRGETLLLDLLFCYSTVASLNFAHVFMFVSTQDMVFEDGSENSGENRNIILVAFEIYYDF